MNGRHEAGKQKRKSEKFEFCKVCKLNHNQGRRHMYFPTHIKALSRLFSRFESKISEALLFLRNPSLLRPDSASYHHIWCVFCDSDIHDDESSFSCYSVITHLAGAEHFKALKHFLWKYGDHSDRLDAFTISQEDFLKWKKKCELLKPKFEASNSNVLQPKIGAANNIHIEMNHDNRPHIDQTIVSSFTSTHSVGVAPLPFYTSERYQISHSEDSSEPHLVRSGLNSLSRTGVMNFKDVLGTGKANENVHSGAPPPWLAATGTEHFDIQASPGLCTFVSSHAGSSRKLNMQRVGAAWAERRKIEIEMEKKGGITENKFTHDWLPNFGRVWQSGTRKESRREFEAGKKFRHSETQSGNAIIFQPYVSKRMRENGGS